MEELSPECFAKTGRLIMRRSSFELRLEILKTLNGGPKILSRLLIGINCTELKERHLSVLVDRGYVELTPHPNVGMHHCRCPDRKIKGVFHLSDKGRMALHELSNLQAIIDDLSAVVS